jgi:hypothetical protein
MNTVDLRRRRAVVVLLLAVCCSLVAVFGFFFFRDNFSTHYPVKAVSAGVFRAGEIPYWNFHDGGGQPLAGNPNTVTFYPDNFLYLLLPVHVAFNLHFLIHLIAAWFAMRALSRSTAAAGLYVLSGVAISSTAFYNLIVAVAVIPFAFWAAERRHIFLLGTAFGLLGLAGEPVMVLGAAIGVAILWPSWRLAPAALISAVIALPQLIAYAEIASEVERARGYSAQTALNASLDPMRVIDMLVGPIAPIAEPHLFLSLMIGVIAIPALWQKSRYVWIAGVSFFLALGKFNPVVRLLVESIPAVRIVRFPEKFVIPLTVAIVVLAAKPLRNRVWQLITFVPVVLTAALTLPIDWWKPYVTDTLQPMRVFVPRSPGGQEPSRADYRGRARRLEPTFGAAAGLRYALDRSPDGMFSIMTRIATERLQTTRNAKWARIAGCQNVPRALPRAMIVPQIAGVDTVQNAVQRIESNAFDEQTTAAGPADLNGFRSPAQATILSVGQGSQALEIRIVTPAPAVLMVNETYFRAWDAGGLRTFPLDLDRLGIMVPAGERTILLRFGRHRTAVLASWTVSLLLLALAAAALRIEVFDRGAREVERAGDEDRAPAQA